MKLILRNLFGTRKIELDEKEATYFLEKKEEAKNKMITDVINNFFESSKVFIGVILCFVIFFGVFFVLNRVGVFG